MATAAGVAGGILVAGAITSLMSGGAHAGGNPGGRDAAAAGETGTPDAAHAHTEQPRQDVADDGGGWFGGDSGGDFEL